MCDVGSEAVDPDGDPVTYAITWARNGSEYGGPTLSQQFSGDTVPAAQTQDGDRWKCSVVASDGVLTAPVAVTERAVFEVQNPTSLLRVYLKTAKRGTECRPLGTSIMTAMEML